MKKLLLFLSIGIVLSGCASNTKNSEQSNEENTQINTIKEKEENAKEISKLKKEIEELKEEKTNDDGKNSKTKEDKNTNKYKSGPVEVNKSQLTVMKDHPLNELGSFKIIYQDNEGHQYIEDQKTGLMYNFAQYFQEESIWDPYIEEYNQALQNYYNEIPDSNDIDNSRILDYVDETTFDIIKNNKLSGNFSNHYSTIEYIKAYKDSETSIVILATRNYSHATGSDIITNKYYIDLINGNKITRWEETE